MQGFANCLIVQARPASPIGCHLLDVYSAMLCIEALILAWVKASPFLNFKSQKTKYIV